MLGIVGISGVKKMIPVLGYEFNAMLTTRAAWNVYPNIALLIALNFYLIERLLNNLSIFNLLFFILAMLVMYSEVGLYFTLVYGTVLLIYLVFRLVHLKKIKVKILFGSALVLIFSSSFFILGKFDEIFASTRFNDNYSNFLLMLPKWYEGIQLSYLEDAFRRTIGQTIGGIHTDFIGTSNLIGGPALYCGIIVLLLVPVAFYNLDRKNKILFGLLYMLSIAYICIPIINIVFNGFSFSEMMYKMSSFWISIVFLLNISIFLYNVEKNRIKKR
ncbi:YfhO family protein [Butyrivibrio sp. WCD3002]|uniref:YfhO family protein n=1 Tax=Butyrivibrio sp. WCD3002 TaxID=1280676 RepID=UPI000478EAD8|nr:hypothetical protein [Butyrivibrio sp. WCD3002]